MYTKVTKTHKRKTTIDVQIPFFNILKNETRKKEITIRILLSKVVVKQKTKTEVGIHFQCSGKTENENGISNSFFRSRE